MKKEDKLKHELAMATAKDCKVHNFEIFGQSFDLIKEGIKTFYCHARTKGPYSQIKAGDIIVFTSIDTGDEFSITVKHVDNFASNSVAGW